MIYPIVVKKIPNGKYFACSTSIRSVFGVGDTMNEALNKAQNRLLCFVHDDDVFIDVKFVGENRKNEGENRISNL